MGSEPFLSALLTTIQQLQSTGGVGSVDVAYLGSTLRKEGHDWATHDFGRSSIGGWMRRFRPMCDKHIVGRHLPPIERGFEP